MRVLILDDQTLAITRVAELIAELIRSKPNAVLGLATGGTMVPLYKQLAEMRQASGLSFAGVTSFNLDEYIGLPPDHPCSARRPLTPAIAGEFPTVCGTREMRQDGVAEGTRLGSNLLRQYNGKG